MVQKKLLHGENFSGGLRVFITTYTYVLNKFNTIAASTYFYNYEVVPTCLQKSSSRFAHQK
jgi:hypothetical protein